MPTRAETYALVMEMTIDEIVTRLIERYDLLPTQVADLAGAKDRKSPVRWASGEAQPRPAAERRLRVAYRAVMTIEDTFPDEGRFRPWLLNSNPSLDEGTPLHAIATDRHAEAINAVEAYCVSTLPGQRA